MFFTLTPTLSHQGRGRFWIYYEAVLIVMASSEKVRIRMNIQGRVQGVFFRASTRDEAFSLDLKGWVCNLPGGGVEVLAEGDREPLLKLVAWCRHGPPYAEVTHVDISEEPYTGEFDTFHIRYE
jgi:acylphosphatase